MRSTSSLARMLTLTLLAVLPACGSSSTPSDSRTDSGDGSDAVGDDAMSGSGGGRGSSDGGSSDTGNGPLDAAVTDAGNDGAGAAIVRERIEDIRHDCRQTAICQADRGSPVLGDDPVGDCVEFTAELLENDAMVRENFDENFGRCADLLACAYLDCVAGSAS